MNKETEFYLKNPIAWVKKYIPRPIDITKPQIEDMARIMEYNSSILKTPGKPLFKKLRTFEYAMSKAKELSTAQQLTIHIVSIGIFTYLDEAGELLNSKGATHEGTFINGKLITAKDH